MKPVSPYTTWHAVLLRLLSPAMLGLLVLLLGAGTAALAQTSGEDKEKKQNELKTLVGTLDDIERRLNDRWRDDEEVLGSWSKVIGTIKENAGKCVPATEQDLKKSNEKIATLGEPSKGEPAEVVRQRRELDEQKTALDNRVATCKVLILRSDELLPRIEDVLKHRQAERLLARGPSITEVLKDEGLEPRSWLSGANTYFHERSALLQLQAWHWGLLALVLVLGASVGVLMRHGLVAWEAEHRWQDSLSSRIGRSLIVGIARYAPRVGFGIAAAIFFFFVTGYISPIAVINVLAYGLPAYFVLLILIHASLTPPSPDKPFLPLPAETSRAFATSLKVFAALVFVAYLLFATFLSQRLPEPLLLLARAVFALVFFANLVWPLWLLIRAPGLARTTGIIVVLTLVLLGAFAAELLGFRNLSTAAVQATAGTLIALGIFGLVRRLLRELYDGLNRGRHPWHRRFRQRLALNSGDPVPGLIWVRLITSLVLWAALLASVLHLWGLPDAYFEQFYTWIAAGFTVGSLRVNPTRIVLALFTLTTLLMLSGWVRSRLRRRWLARTTMDRGAREATVTIIGYLGVALAFVIALAVAGFEFTNLAIIAGALSVGIGFGLQAIVNNFVSGLILLFERPIKTGDWIVVGNTEGYVKRISIRSTMIQTFDRADVIVPNSDLISNQVTNWMLYDPRGRIRVPIGVAYGSDTEKVRELLLEIASTHPEVITDGTSPAPRVLFLQFGDSSLDFEVRCHIRNIDLRRIVMSDLNFAIDKAFREHGVEIPFPQRDVHIRDWPQEKKPSTLRRGKRPKA
jgi:potassium-dependent mechanosensitive channel